MIKNIGIKKNIILLTIDCLRGDHLTCMGYKKKITPNIDKLAFNGILFTNAISNGGNTFFSIPSLLTSALSPVIDKTLITITEVLHENGYSTAALNPNPMTFIKVKNMKCIRISRGFDKYEIMLSNISIILLAIGFFRMCFTKFLLRKYLDKNGLTYKILYNIYDKSIKLFPWFFLPNEHLNVPTADQLNEVALKWLKKQNKEFFLWIHYMDVHEPYASPYTENKETLFLLTKYRDFPNKLSKYEIGKLHMLYERQIKYIDKAIGSLIESLKNMGKYEDTVFIITADHGDAFGEHGLLGHGGEFPANVYEELIHVPLVIHGLEKNKKIFKQVQLLDLAPTICEITGVKPPDTFKGKSLFYDYKRKIFSNSESAMSYRTDKFKIIINKTRDRKIEMYDIKKDPYETNDLFNQKKDIGIKLANEMLAMLEKSNKGKIKKHVMERIVQKTST